MRDRPGGSQTGSWVGDGWAALSTIITGIALWGAIGYGLDRLFGSDPWLMVTGVLVGHFAAIYLIYVRAQKAEESSNRAA